MRRTPTRKLSLKARLADEHGGIATMAAVIMIPLCVMGLAAVEYHHLVLTRTKLQNAMDAATLTAARSGRSDNAGLKQAGLPAFKAHLGKSQASRRVKDEDVAFVQGAGQVEGSARVCVQPIVSGMLGVRSTCVVTAATVKREDVKLEVVLVLDSSGSMDQPSSMPGMTRMDALEAASQNFVTRMQSIAATSSASAVKVGVVPFSGVVRVNPSDSSVRPWLDVDGRSSVNADLFHSINNRGVLTPIANPRRLDLFASMGISWRGCLESRPHPLDVSDAPPTSANPNSLFVPYFAPDEPDVVDWGLANQSILYPNDYIDDGLQGLNPPELDDIYGNPVNSRSAQYVAAKYTAARVDEVRSYQGGAVWRRLDRNSTQWGPNRWCHLDPITPLTTDLVAVKSAVQNMPTTPQTNIALGLMWGWHVLSPNAPWARGRPYREGGLRKIVVLMTDGENWLDMPNNVNRSSFSSTGYLWRGQLGLPVSASASQVTQALNARVNTICSSLRAQDVTIFAIQLEMGGANDAVLRNCSGADNFYNVQSAAQLDGVFQKIGSEISELRVAS
jgi:Flp pilus assembly protein TadG